MTFYCTDCEKELNISDKTWKELNCYFWEFCPFCGGDLRDKEDLEQEGYFAEAGECGEASCNPCIDCKNPER